MTTKTDDELLTLAAKAAGGLVHVDPIGWIHEDADGNRGAWWHPLDSDGDALRLAVKLELCVDTNADTLQRFDTDEKCTLAVLPRPSEKSAGEWHAHTDPYTATRRAIVRAAAALGETMP